METVRIGVSTRAQPNRETQALQLDTREGRPSSVLAKLTVPLGDRRGFEPSADDHLGEQPPPWVQSWVRSFIVIITDSETFSSKVEYAARIQAGRDHDLDPTVFTCDFQEDCMKT